MNIKNIRHIFVAFPILIMSGCVKGLLDHEELSMGHIMACEEGAP